MPLVVVRLRRHPELVRGDWVRPGAVVIDVGINVVSTLPRHGARHAPRTGQGGQVAGQAGGSQGPAAAGAAGNNGRDPGQPSRHAGTVEAASPPYVSCTAGAGGAAECQGGVGHGEEAGEGAEGAEGGSFGQGRSGSPLSSTGGGSGNGGIWYDSSTASVQRNVTFQVVGDVAFEEVSQVGAVDGPGPGSRFPGPRPRALAQPVPRAHDTCCGQFN